MLQQEKEFAAWGLSKLAVRNIIIFFFAILLTATAALTRITVWLYQEAKAAERREMDCRNQSAEIINRLRVEQIDMLQKTMVRQEEIEQGLQEAKRRLNKLVKVK